jgi:hypothetical protein
MAERRVSILDLESLTTILQDLAPDGIELYELRYYPQAFGSLELVLGLGHERVKFTWDGRDSILSVSFARATNKNANVSWTHDADISLPKGEGLFAEIASNAQQMLAT